MYTVHWFLPGTSDKFSLLALIKPVLTKFNCGILLTMNKSVY